MASLKLKVIRGFISALFTITVTAALGQIRDIAVLGEPYKEIINNQGFADAVAGSEFSATLVSGGPVVHKFYIITTVPGTDFSITGAPTITGTHMADFSASVTTGGSTPFGSLLLMTISFDPSAAGVREAVISIPNNDPDENPYVFPLIGSGVDSPPAPAPNLLVQLSRPLKTKVNRRTGTTKVKGVVDVFNNGTVAADFVAINIVASSHTYFNLFENPLLFSKTYRGVEPFDPSRPTSRKIRFKIDTGHVSGTVFPCVFPGEVQTDEYYTDNVTSIPFAPPI